MIVVRIWEGLGNQLFQYAFARMLKKQGYHVVLDKREIEDDISFARYRNAKRKVVLDKFRIAISFATERELKGFSYLLNQNQFDKRIANISKRGLGISVYREQKEPYEFEPISGNIWRNTYFKGWYQNPQYFQQIRRELLSEIYPKEKIKITSQLRNTLKRNNIVAVHIRRGDYKFHQVCLPIDYYNRAMKKISEWIFEPAYLFFSDDIEWVKEQFGEKDNYYYMDESMGKYEDFEELMIMSRCQHFIIANSTFSWWGAWLSRNDEKIVVAPKCWFGNKGAYTAEQILPTEWIKL